MSEPYYSRVYTDRPLYADYDAPAKFQAIQSIIARRLREHPNAICSYSGGGRQRHYDRPDRADAKDVQLSAD